MRQIKEVNAGAVGDMVTWFAGFCLLHCTQLLKVECNNWQKPTLLLFFLQGTGAWLRCSPADTG